MTQQQLEHFNEDSYSAKEFEAILNHLSKGNVFEKTKTFYSRIIGLCTDIIVPAY